MSFFKRSLKATGSAISATVANVTSALTGTGGYLDAGTLTSAATIDWDARGIGAGGDGILVDLDLAHDADITVTNLGDAPVVIRGTMGGSLSHTLEFTTAGLTQREVQGVLSDIGALATDGDIFEVSLEKVGSEVWITVLTFEI